MGYTLSAIERIIKDKAIFKGKKVITLGTLYPFLSDSEHNEMGKYGIKKNISKEEFSKYLFVDLLGAECCHSLDISDYQQAEIICNLNHPISDELKYRYDVLIDAGTLEHLSNLSIALKNIFDLLSDDGIYYFGTVCNNWVDHGFFQFSPTFFVDLCIENRNLELSDLYIATFKKTYYIENLKPALKTALYTSREKLGVGGMITKKSNDFDLNLMQSKYRDLYHTKTSIDANFPSSKQSLLRKLAGFLVYRFSTSRFISLNVKEIVLNWLYKLK